MLPFSEWEQARPCRRLWPARVRAGPRRCVAGRWKAPAAREQPLGRDEELRGPAPPAVRLAQDGEIKGPIEEGLEPGAEARGFVEVLARRQPDQPQDAAIAQDRVTGGVDAGQPRCCRLGPGFGAGGRRLHRRAGQDRDHDSCKKGLHPHRDYATRRFVRPGSSAG